MIYPFFFVNEQTGAERLYSFMFYKKDIRTFKTIITISLHRNTKMSIPLNPRYSDGSENTQRPKYFYYYKDF
jgi:hypothetical protein